MAHVVRNPVRRSAAAIVAMGVAVLGACTGDAVGPEGKAETATLEPLVAASVSPPFPVAGTGIFFSGTEIIHSAEPTEGGLIQRSTSAGQLNGDLNGAILFNPTSVFNFVDGTLVNTGTQFFVGTVAGSGPVILHDDQFRFEIDLGTGQTLGTVHLSRSMDAPHGGAWFECDLVVVGTGVTAEGHITSEYSGECIRRGKMP